ncbi:MULTISPECIES: sodium-dependent transporter [unclassified Campylobacter]|uniref:sodium-dependent transporter n=1 Tax=unclassified Campylobacter TaxID=2593542 RepID=UPI001BDB41EB|nr:sodium-dependent transporter [Campylobacter sp. 2018MI10]MBT0884979.1 sodium-dependent transporter [Campylobacter sp. 2018MI10]MBZ7977327.1 sodium-dependent transporter [Campylobacter sp. RM12654]MBZ7980933.1 sodium-dependent transporter [Campylobacter sp. RM12640]MBZ7988252.1 sodium-dependent transporter [Campylobacter sp. RM12635]
MKRLTWSNRLTYILTVAGATIGFGATWRFPYMVGENGGGAYVLLFIIAMFLVGVPIILVENIIGRRMHKNSVDCFSKKWQFVGYLGLFGSYAIMAYYMVLGAWVISYIVNIIMSMFNLGGLDLTSVITAEQTSLHYQKNIENDPLMIGIYTFIFVFINWIILRRGVIDGIERSVKYLMPLLFLCLIAMVIRNVTLDGAIEGIKFYLYPDFSKITPNIFLYVIGQVFFALSLGFGVMITLSSYLDKGEDLLKTAIITGIVNTLVAVLAGFMIFPSLFSFGLSPDAGPSLVFKTLPIVFSHMHFGDFFAIVFFVLLLTAALTTSLPIYQVIISVLEEKFKISKNTAINLVLGGIFILGNIPALLSYGVLDNVLIYGRNIFDTFDFISGNILFVITALLCVIYVAFVLGKDEALREISNNYELKNPLYKAWFYYIKYFIPIVIIVIFISGFENLKSYILGFFN